MSAITEPGPSVAGTKAAAAVPSRLAGELHRKSGAERWKLPVERFADALERSVAHMFRDSKPSASEVESYLRSLHIEDLALACACTEGSEPAWEHFVREFRPLLYAAARAVSRSGQGGESNARELADSIYADLFGLTSGQTEGPAGRKGGLFRYFHGRSKLSTWLRAVLAQRHVDALRSARRTESLDEEQESAAPKSAAVPRDDAGSAPPDPERVRYTALLQATLTAALAALDARDRLRLCYYYVQDLTLAQIGRLLGEHEATVSRKLDRARGDLRKQVERRLRDGSGLSDAQVQLCFDYAREKWPFDLTGALGKGLPSSQPARGEKQ